VALAAHVLIAALSTCATGAAVAFWANVLLPKGGVAHRRVGRWFARLLYASAATAGMVLLVSLAWPSVISDDLAALSMRHVLLLAPYTLVILIAPAQHGVGAIAAGPLPMTLRSRAHALLNTAAIVGSLFVFPAALIWRAWMFVLMTPAGFVIGLRNMRYASHVSATPDEWQREHLTSLITAGMALHTMLGVLASLRWPSRLGGVGWSILFLGPWAIGLPICLWLRATWRAR
jgi:hypothetical protein